jgi:DNA mismatch endonuclease Vsr
MKPADSTLLKLKKMRKSQAQVRSDNMRAIRSFGNTTTENRLKAMLVRRAVAGWMLHPAGVPGNPDFFFPGQRLAIFVDGCFWHSCPRCGHIPRTNRSYWLPKLARNKRRDRETSKALKALGYRVTRIWECQLKSTPKRCVARILNTMRTNRKTSR